MSFLFSVNMDGIDSTLIFLLGITFQLVIYGELVKNDTFVVNGFHFDQEKREKKERSSLESSIKATWS